MVWPLTADSAHSLELGGVFTLHAYNGRACAMSVLLQQSATGVPTCAHTYAVASGQLARLGLQSHFQPTSIGMNWCHSQRGQTGCALHLRWVKRNVRFLIIETQQA